MATQRMDIGKAMYHPSSGFKMFFGALLSSPSFCNFLSSSAVSTPSLEEQGAEGSHGGSR